MHELSLAEAMLDIIKEQAERDNFTRVTLVVLEIGELSHVEANAMAFSFDAVVAGSLAEGASLKIERVPAKGQCQHCNKKSPMQHLYDPCAYCGEFGLALVEGDELRIKHLEVI